MKLSLAFVAPVLAVLLPAAPAQAATLFDYSVYSAGSASISGGSYGDIASATFFNANGPTGTNFTSRAAATADLTSAAASASAYLGGLAATGTLSQATQYNPEQGILTGTSTGINVFNLTGSQWRALNTVVVDGPGTGAIINIFGTGTFNNWVNLDQNWRGSALDRFAARNVILNFVEASDVQLGGTVNGSVLAPGANFSIYGGSIAGSVAARNFTSAGTIIGGNGFTGAALSAVPEPGTWAMMILGAGLVGGMLRRRRAAGARVALA